MFPEMNNLKQNHLNGKNCTTGQMKRYLDILCAPVQLLVNVKYLIIQ